jgi:tetratricopeptide (TPR) repeat protein
MNDDLSDIMARLDVPDRHLIDVLPVKITVALESGDTEYAAAMVGPLIEKDREIGMLYSADLEMKRGNHTKALDIIGSLSGTDRFEVRLRMAGALGYLGDVKRAIKILEEMKHNVISSGSVGGLDRIYVQMSAVSAASGDHDSSVAYLTKALGVTTDGGKKRIYGMLANSYDALGMKDKAKECSKKS